MNEVEALREIKGYAAAGRIAYTRHAEERMVQREIRRADVRVAIAMATQAQGQPNETWRVTGGVDMTGEPLTVVAALEQGVLVITVF